MAEVIQSRKAKTLKPLPVKEYSILGFSRLRSSQKCLDYQFITINYRKLFPVPHSLFPALTGKFKNN
jgi:hypothetical protein